MDILPKVKEWLEKQGFSLEMKAASAFKAAGFEVRQSNYYIDPESNKPREMDVIASHPDVMGIIHIAFIIECKSSSKPWLLLCSPDVLRGYNILSTYAAISEDARLAVLDRLESLEPAQFLDLLPWLRKPELVGYSARQAFSDVDGAYVATMNVAKACRAFLRENNSKSMKYKTLCFAFPVIVVDSPLIRASLDDDGTVRLEEVHKAEFLFNGYVPEHFGTCIRVISDKYLGEFAIEAKQVGDQIRSTLKPEEDAIVESWKRK